MVMATLVGLVARSGFWGGDAEALASFLALLTAFVTSPVIALHQRPLLHRPHPGAGRRHPRPPMLYLRAPFRR